MRTSTILTHLLGGGRRRSVASLTSLLALVAAVALPVSALVAASPAPAAASLANGSHSGQALRIGSHNAVLVSAPTPAPSRLLKSLDARLPALRRDLASGESLPVAWRKAGLPALHGHAVGLVTNSSGRLRPEGASCQDWTCGWEFGPLSTFEIEWAVWAGTIIGPGSACLFVATFTAGLGCFAAASLWALISAYVDTPPSYNAYKCLYIGIGFGEVAKFDRC